MTVYLSTHFQEVSEDLAGFTTVVPLYIHFCKVPPDLLQLHDVYSMAGYTVGTEGLKQIHARVDDEFEHNFGKKGDKT